MWKKRNLPAARQRTQQAPRTDQSPPRHRLSNRSHWQDVV